MKLNFSFKRLFEITYFFLQINCETIFTIRLWMALKVYYYIGAATNNIHKMSDILALSIALCAKSVAESTC